MTDDMIPGNSDNEIDITSVLDGPDEPAEEASDVEESLESPVEERSEKLSPHKRSAQYRIDQLHAKAKTHEEEAGRLRSENENLKQLLEEMNSHLTNIFGNDHLNAAAGQPATAQQFSQADIAKMLQQELESRDSRQSEIYNLANQWKPHLSRLSQSSGKFKDKFPDWLTNYTGDIENNGEKRALMEAASSFKYAPEVLFAVENSPGADKLSMPKKLALMAKTHEKIRETRDKLPAASDVAAQVKGSAPGGGKTLADMSDEEFYKMRQQNKSGRGQIESY